MTIKYSIIPYVIIISVMLFLTVKLILNTKTAIISLILYSFFAPSLFLETLGLHFISSTAAFMVFFYLIILNFRQNKRLLAIFTGISCGFCYLFYNTSFIALPFILIIFFIQMIKLGKISVLTNLMFALISFFIVMGPYIGYISKNGNYFTSRMEQVSLLTGSWSGAPDAIKKGANPINIVKDNFFLSVESLYKDRIGGHGGYNFGYLAFFEKYTLYLFIAGTIVGLILSVRRIEILFVLLITLTAFLALVVLSIPPPAYHRFALALPFLAIIMSLPFYVLFWLTKKIKIAGYIIAVIVLIVYCSNNRVYFSKTTEKEGYNESIMISDYINEHFPKRRLYIASFPGFGFDKVYYFSKGKNAISVVTGYHDGFLENFNPNEKYVYAIIFPHDFNEKFQKLDKNGRIINISKGYSLFVN